MAVAATISRAISTILADQTPRRSFRAAACGFGRGKIFSPATKSFTTTAENTSTELLRISAAGVRNAGASITGATDVGVAKPDSESQSQFPVGRGDYR